MVNDNGRKDGDAHLHVRADNSHDDVVDVAHFHVHTVSVEM